MGVLNSIPGCLIRGENDNFFYHLYKSYKSILTLKTLSPLDSPSHPWFGSSSVQEEGVIQKMSELARLVILSDQEQNSTITCYGFKEIRYMSILNPYQIDGQAEFNSYLNFLQKIFPDCCFIFNCREKHDVINSLSVSFWKEKHDLPRRAEHYIRKVNLLKKMFNNFHRRNLDRSYQVSYEDVVSRSENFKRLFAFLGVDYAEESIEKVLSVQHSYNPFQEAVKNLPKD